MPIVFVHGIAVRRDRFERLLGTVSTGFALAECPLAVTRRSSRRGRRHRGGGRRCCRRRDFDEVIAVPEADAFAMAREAARGDGIFSRPSTGLNLVAARLVARRLGPGHRVVTVQVDSGLKYLAGDLYS